MISDEMITCLRMQNRLGECGYNITEAVLQPASLRAGSGFQGGEQEPKRNKRNQSLAQGYSCGTMVWLICRW